MNRTRIVCALLVVALLVLLSPPWQGGAAGHAPSAVEPAVVAVETPDAASPLFEERNASLPHETSPGRASSRSTVPRAMPRFGR